MDEWSYIVSDMKTSLTAIIRQEDGCWIGWVEEIPGVNAQEKTVKNCW